MANQFLSTRFWGFCGTAELPANRGRFLLTGGQAICRQSFLTDPIGTTTVTFSGVVAGSEIRVYLPDGPNGAAGTEVAGLDSCVENQQLTWDVYSAGSPNNNVWIHLLKRGLRWQKFSYTSKTGAQSIPIFQNTDLGYNNPA